MKTDQIGILILLLVIISILGACTPTNQTKNCNTMMTPEHEINSRTLQLLNEMNNNDVVWVADFIALRPRELTGATLLLRSVQDDITPWLIDALLDKDKFVAAHVLLTWRTDTAVFGKAGEWNGLQVQHSEGGTFFEGNDLYTLQKYWCEKLQP